MLNLVIFARLKASFFVILMPWGSIVKSSRVPVAYMFKTKKGAARINRKGFVIDRFMNSFQLELTYQIIRPRKVIRIVALRMDLIRLFFI